MVKDKGNNNKGANFICLCPEGYIYHYNEVCPICYSTYGVKLDNVLRVRGNNKPLQEKRSGI